MNIPSVLQNEKILLQRITINDFDVLFAVASDPLIWEQHPDKLRYQKNIFKKYFDSAIASKAAFLIVDKSTNQVIGSSRFYDFDEMNKVLKIGYTFLARKYWGTNYNNLLKQLMIDFAFSFVDTVIFSIGENNIRSQKAIQKIGAQYLKKEGSSLQYFISKNDWKNFHNQS